MTDQGVCEVNAAAASDAGRMRSTNEDRFLLDVDSGVFLVVDGVGGHAHGDVAADIAVATIRERLLRSDAPNAVRAQEAIVLANRAIHSRSTADPELNGMACVLTLALLDGDELTIGHVGDSRLYRLDPSGIHKLTTDHSPIGELEVAKLISEADAMQHTRRNEVYRDVGSEHRALETPGFVDVIVTRFEEDSAILLCSDGLSDMVMASEVNRVVRSFAGEPARVVETLIDAANRQGGRDNITVVYAERTGFQSLRGNFESVPVDTAETEVVTTPLRPSEETQARSLPIVEQRTTREQRALFRAAPAVSNSRALYFAMGAILAFAVAVLAMAVSPALLWRSQTDWTVGGASSNGLRTIGEAINRARPGDVIRVEPGEYREAIVISRDVTLLSSVPGGAVVTAPAGAPQWVSIDVRAGRTLMRGFRIVGDASSKSSVGVRAQSAKVQIEDTSFEGNLGIGLDLHAASQVSIIASRFSAIAQVPIAIGENAEAIVRNCFFVVPGRASSAIRIARAGTLRADSNLFVNYADVFEPPAAQVDSRIISNSGAFKIERHE